jgi:fatty acid synthase, animal type
VFCPQLEHFVFFSSVSCGRGSGAQTNYGLSNSVGEKIIELRRRDNLPGKAIQFGPIKDVGLLSETSQEIISGFGYLLQNMQSCCDVFDQVFLRHEAVFSSMICASKKKAAGNDYQEMLMSLLGRIGITDEATIDPNQTLASLGVDSISGVEIQQFFLREFGITMTVKELRLKTYKETKDLIQKMIK